MRYWMFGLAMLASQPAAAQTVAPSGPLTVTAVTIENDAITVSANGYNNPQQCSFGGAVIIGRNADSRDMYLSLAITALAGNLRMNIWTAPGCVPHVNGTIAVAYHVSLIR